ncbi:MAG TPA: FliM/FliN family flagellar motor switch protein [Bryobacteraceae bacterium]
MKRVLSQQEIDAVFQAGEGADAAAEAVPFDFGRLDRIPKSQLRALHLVHENFVRSLTSGLSAYLRSYVAINLVSLEQISYSEFLEGLASPTCIAYLGLQPFDGTALLELNVNLMFALLELLLGSKGLSSSLTVQRKITDIEKTVVHTLTRVILRDLEEAWKSVAPVSFTVQSLASEPQMLHVLAHAEAVVVIAIEMRVASVSGLMNLAIPSIFIKRLRYNFDSLQQVRKAESTERGQLHLAGLLQDAQMNFAAQIDGGSVSTRTLLDLEAGDILLLDHALDRPVRGYVNGCAKWLGEIVNRRDRLAFEVREQATLS